MEHWGDKDTPEKEHTRQAGEVDAASLDEELAAQITAQNNERGSDCFGEERTLLQKAVVPRGDTTGFVRRRLGETAQLGCHSFGLA